LFNTLEAIRMQSLADGNRDVARTIKLLAKILRHNLDATDRPVPLVDEVEAVSNYLDIQHLRFADRVSYDIMFMCDVEGLVILPLLIQPLVENSFSHGLEDRQLGGFISITIDNDVNGDLEIKIRDNGSGISEQKLEQLRERLATGTVENFTTSIGMANVNQRIKLFYGEKYGIEIESQLGAGTEVIMRIPRVSMAGKGEGKDV
ncbi:MAG: histidine kinase, partial [Treponema sp.]|nr:histidine kinase [Treponema sp.]